MELLNAISREAVSDRSHWLLIVYVLTLACGSLPGQEEKPRLRLISGFVFLHLLFMALAAAFEAEPGNLERDLRLLALIFSAAAFVSMADLLLFGAFLQRWGMRTPHIVRDVAASSAGAVAVFFIASRMGLNLAGLVATSAVLTAVVGLSLQDTLGNVMGGLAIQLDKSIQVGDWIKIEDIAGQVKEIHWRYTAIETNNWETAVIPNSAIIKGKLLVYGRRANQPLQWRRWVYFNVDFRTPPTQVIEALNQALQMVPMENVAENPAPHCLLMGLQESVARYAVRYWLTELSADDRTDSLVRTKIYFVLKRLGIPLAIPAEAVFVTQESVQRGAEKEQQELVRRLQALEKVSLFHGLSAQEKTDLAAGLKHVPFMRGETLVKQGAAAHWLYMLTDGEVSVRVRGKLGEVEVARLKEGSFFGEGGLMTGEPRSASVVALSDVDCYRLDKAAFQTLLKNRPAIAEYVAEVMAQRRLEYAAKENLDQETRERHLAANKNDLVAKIRAFFGI